MITIASDWNKHFVCYQIETHTCLLLINKTELHFTLSINECIMIVLYVLYAMDLYFHLIILFVLSCCLSKLYFMFDNENDIISIIKIK